MNSLCTVELIKRVQKEKFLSGKLQAILTQVRKSRREGWRGSCDIYRPHRALTCDSSQFLNVLSMNDLITLHISRVILDEHVKGAR